jgi:electron transfer flavoprotein beta subunit
MNILVCFKAVPDLEMLIEEDWVIDEDLQIDTGFLKPGLNCFDESALEIALRLRDVSASFEVPLKLNALTVDDAGVTSILKTLNALGFNRVVRIDNHADIRFNPAAVASLLSQYVLRHEPQDLLLLGRQSSIGENVKTPLLVAEMLGWPCITQATRIELVDKKHLTVTCQVDDGQLRQTVQTPCVVSVGNAPITYMRVPTLEDRMQFGNRPVEILSAKDFETSPRAEELVGLEPVHHKRPGRVIEGKTPRAKARKLYECYLKQRLARP